MEHLKRFHQQGTVIVVLHDLSLSARYCDHAVVMRAGKVIDFGKVENTITAEKMSRLLKCLFIKLFMKTSNSFIVSLHFIFYEEEI